jgi:membrane AbrB-like protein
LNLLLALIVAAVGGLIGVKIGLPQGALLGSLIAVSIVNATGVMDVKRLPEPAMFAVYALIAVELGSRVDRSTIATLGKAWLPIVLFVIALIVFTVLVSIAMARLFDVSLATALYGTAPGALSGITAAGGEVGANVAVMTAMHTLRVTAIVVAIPLIHRLLVH